MVRVPWNPTDLTLFCHSDLLTWHILETNIFAYYGIQYADPSDLDNDSFESKDKNFLMFIIGSITYIYQGR